MARWVFLVCLICSAFCHAAGQSPIYALKEGEVTLKPDTDGEAEGILWIHNGNRVVEFDGKEQYVYDTYDNRVTLDWVTAVLSITDLRFEDSGEYRALVDNKKVLHRSAYKLEVIEKVASPNISCEMSNSGSTIVSAQLLCSAEPRGPLMKFEWRTHGNLQPGQQLQISLGAEHDDEVYTCNVSNPLSSETATFTAKDCYPDGSSGGKIAGTVVHVLVVGVSITMIYIIIVLAVEFFKHRHQRHVSSAIKALFEQNKDGQSSQKEITGYIRCASDDNGNADQHRTPRKRLSSSKPDQKVSITPEHPEPKKEAEEDEEALSAPAGEDEKALSAPAGEDEKAHSAPAGEDEEALSAPAGEDEEALSAPAGEDEKALSAPAGEDEEALSAPAGEDEEALSAPAGASPAAQPPSLLAWKSSKKGT